MADRYALRDHDDRVDGNGTTWWVYLPTSGRTLYLVADGTDWLLEAAAVRDWWKIPDHVIFDPETARFALVSKPRKVTVSYKRVLPVDGYPATMSVEEYTEGWDDGEGNGRLGMIYEPVQEEQPPSIETVEGGWIVLDGAPPKPDPWGRKWVANLPYELREHKEYLHLFPGYLDGFTEWVAAKLDELPGVRSFTSSGKLVVYLSVALPRPPHDPWDAPPSYDGLTAREKKKRREAVQSGTITATRHLTIPHPHRIDGENRAAAEAKWDQVMESIVGRVRDMLAHPCPTCHGHGWVEGEDT